ncbi:DNA-binding protein, partial [Streptomyces sp. A73]|nr:DNA-binding protein [Streptomyces sp. A73]
HAGRPASTIRRWAAEGRIRRYGSGRGKVRYDLNELPLAVRDESTREVLWHEDTPPMPESAPRAA